MKALRFVLAALCAAAAAGATAQPVKIKFAIFTPDKEQTFLTVMKPFAEAVNRTPPARWRSSSFPRRARPQPAAQAQMVLAASPTSLVIASYTRGGSRERGVRAARQFRDLQKRPRWFTRLVPRRKIRGYDEFPSDRLFARALQPARAQPDQTIADIKAKKIRLLGAIEARRSRPSARCRSACR